VGNLHSRLSSQLKARGVKNSSSVAAAILQKRGHMDGNKITTEGKKRQALGNEGRAKDRAVKQSGGKPSDYKYNPKTNRTKKNG
jgi:hypothetical protein